MDAARVSIEAINWAFGLATPKSLSTMGSWKAVLLSLANHADKTGGSCFPSVETIHREAGVSIRTVTDVLKRLAAAGLIVPGRDGRKATYTLIMNLTPEASSTVEDASTQEDASIVEDGSTVEDAASIPEASSDDAGSIFHESRKHLPANLKEPSANPEGNRQKRDAQGHRLPDDWAPSRAGVEFATGLGLDWQRVAAAFCDHWHAKAGKDARKLDWDATWRNWCRTDSQRRGRAPPAQFAGRPTNLSLHLTPETT